MEEPEDKTLNDVSPTQKGKCCMSSLTCDSVSIEVNSGHQELEMKAMGRS